MPKDRPDHHDAELVLKLYDLRREPVMRESRVRIIKEFNPKSWEDVVAVVSNFEHPLNASYRQVSSYWEMAYGIAKWDIAHAEYLVEGNGEGLLTFVKIKPYLERFREEFSPRAYQNTEWVATKTETGRRYVELFQARMAKMAAAAAKR
jgi:hypothetical protein